MRRHLAYALLLSSLLAADAAADARIKDEEVAQVKCEVCEFATLEAHALVVELGVDRKNEEELTDFAESICSLGKREGRWLRRLDVKNMPDKHLQVVNKTEYGECRSECLLVRKACQVALKNKEDSIVDLLRSQTPVGTFTKSICKKACAKKPKPLSYDRKDEAWVQGPDAGMLQIAENRDKLRQETGQVMEVFRREDMESMSDGDKEVMAAQDAFADQMMEARARG
eukprot:gnl/TRDRNA2_/TRDRNA2_126571_c0_seq1.p1 gnl/TRDRNA2_/TRDRNA2_126571_c0~~gnl/TRDRNA2_/TRDRNA2_126571_c0_seq1.p1  ORF type:complete len:227 (+),score=65.60 gnl/TRDRNA2_/TRDRNA2_126571_c0_seq1:57-737(+)